MVLQKNLAFRIFVKNSIHALKCLSEQRWMSTIIYIKFVIKCINLPCTIEIISACNVIYFIALDVLNRSDWKCIICNL